MVVNFGKVLITLGSHVGKGMCQCFVAFSFTTTSRSNNHEAVTNTSGIVQLDDFVFERLNRLQFIIFATMFDGGHQFAVINFGPLGCGKQILDDVLEQR